MTLRSLSLIEGDARYLEPSDRAWLHVPVPFSGAGWYLFGTNSTLAVLQTHCQDAELYWFIRYGLADPRPYIEALTVRAPVHYSATLGASLDPFDFRADELNVGFPAEAGRYLYPGQEFRGPGWYFSETRSVLVAPINALNQQRSSKDLYWFLLYKGRDPRSLFAGFLSAPVRYA